jgi:hypothetical protein
MFSDSFKKQPSPLQNEVIRKQLQDAILADDPSRFRMILEEFLPELAGETRLYSVLTLHEGNMHTIMVDQTGQRLGPDYAIKANTPIEQLNADIVGDELVVTIGDEQYRAYIGNMADRSEEDDKG